MADGLGFPTVNWIEMIGLNIIPSQQPKTRNSSPSELSISVKGTSTPKSCQVKIEVVSSNTPTLMFLMATKTIIEGSAPEKSPLQI